jgi:ribosomal protein L24
MMKFKIGDTVKVTAGKDKGREGKIEKILLNEAKAVIPGVNLYKGWSIRYSQSFGFWKNSLNLSKV